MFVFGNGTLNILWFSIYLPLPSRVVQLDPGTSCAEDFAILEAGIPGIDEDGEKEGEQVEEDEQEDTVGREQGVFNLGQTRSLKKGNRYGNIHTWRSN